MSLKEPRFLPRVTVNATPDHSLAAADPERSVLADITVKPAKSLLLQKTIKL